MREWYHIKCTFEKLKWAQATTKDIEDHIELESWEELEDNEKAQIIQHIADLSSKAIGTLKKKAIVQAKLIATGQVTSPVKDVSFVTNTNPQKFSGFSVKPKNFGEACSSQTLKAIFSSPNVSPSISIARYVSFRSYVPWWLKILATTQRPRSSRTSFGKAEQEIVTTVMCT